MVIGTTYARMNATRFKPGMREEGIKAIDSFAKEPTKGFEGMLALLPLDDEDTVILVTLWDSEEAMNASWKTVSPRVFKALEGLMDGQPEVKNHKVREMETMAISLRA